jgi:hypothetical protein
VVGSDDPATPTDADCVVYFSNDRGCCNELQAAKDMPQGNAAEKTARLLAILAVVATGSCKTSFVAQDSGCTPPSLP